MKADLEAFYQKVRSLRRLLEEKCQTEQAKQGLTEQVVRYHILIEMLREQIPHENSRPPAGPAR